MKTTMLAIGLCALLNGCAIQPIPRTIQDTGPELIGPVLPGYGPSPSRVPAFYGYAPVGYGPRFYAPQYGPYGYSLSNWGPYGGLGGWGIPFHSGGERGK